MLKAVTFTPIVRTASYYLHAKSGCAKIPRERREYHLAYRLYETTAPRSPHSIRSASSATDAPTMEGSLPTPKQGEGVHILRDVNVVRGAINTMLEAMQNVQSETASIFYARIIDAIHGITVALDHIENRCTMCGAVDTFPCPVKDPTVLVAHEMHRIGQFMADMMRGEVAIMVAQPSVWNHLENTMKSKRNIINPVVSHYARGPPFQ